MALIQAGTCNCGCGQKTPIAKRNRKDLGYIKGEPLKFLRGHNPLFVHGPPSPKGMRWCGGCKSTKPTSEFWKAAKQVGGLQYRCKSCVRETTALYRERNREKTNRTAADCHRRKRIGMEPHEYDALYEKQKGLCAICHQPEKAKQRGGHLRPLAVDHCHDTGRVRGLLCNDCNRGIGLLGDDPRRVAAAAKYLRQ